MINHIRIITESKIVFDFRLLILVQVCRAIGSLAELKENKKELDTHNVCKVVTHALLRHVSGDSVFAAVFAFQSEHSAAVAQWG